MTRIGGALDYAALIGRDRHRPGTREEMRAAVVELRRRGLMPRDIAAALELTEPAIRQLLGEVP